MTTQEYETDLEPSVVEAAPYLVFGIPDVGYSSVRIQISEDASETADRIERALKTAAWFRAKFIETFPPSERREAAQRQQNGRSGQRGGGGQSRKERYEETDGECDICGGPVGIYPRTGNMRSDKIVCLGKCKDDKYVHTVAWVDASDDGGYAPW
jgi:hypothetical protein